MTLLLMYILEFSSFYHLALELLISFNLIIMIFMYSTYLYTHNVYRAFRTRIRGN